MKPDYPIKAFKGQRDWEQWLLENGEKVSGVWIRFYKKYAQMKSITYDEALIVALCFGWIDSQTKRYDELSYLQKFTPRRSKSIWSKINTNHVEQLIKEGKMRPSGLRVVEEAKKDGRWNQAYDSPSTATIPQEFYEVLKRHKRAESFFSTLTKSNRYAIAWRLQTAKKEETKKARIEKIVIMLEKQQKFHD